MEFVLSDTGILILAGVVGALTLITLVLLGVTISLSKKIRRLLKGKNAQTLEDTIVALRTEVEELTQAHGATTENLQAVRNRLSQSVQGVGVVRFTAFRGEGNGQSFAVALLNEHGDGVVLSTLHARDRMSIFGKPIAQFHSQHELSEEEQNALTEARQSIG